MYTTVVLFNTLHHTSTTFRKVLNLDLLCVKLQLEGQNSSKISEPDVTVIPFTLDHC